MAGKTRIAGGLFDLHVPHANEKVFKTFIDWTKSEKPNDIFLGGDFMDCVALSRFDKEPSRYDQFNEEILLGKEYLNLIRKHNPQANIKYIIGNHEDRLPKALMRGNSRSLYTIDALQINNLLDFTKFGITKIDYMHRLPSGFIITHGSKLGLRPAQSEALSYWESGMSGHCHRHDEYHRKFLDKQIDWYSCPCACDISQLKYATTWSHAWHNGFPTIRYNDDTQEVRIIITDSFGNIKRV